MPNTLVRFDDVEVLRRDVIGFWCRIAGREVFVGSLLPQRGSTVHGLGDRLVLRREDAANLGLIDRTPLPQRLGRSSVAKGRNDLASDTEEWVQLATRIPKQLHRELKLYCVKSDVSLMDFVVSALQHKLARDARGRRRQRAS